MLETEHQFCNGFVPKYCREKTPPSVHSNGLADCTNGTSKLTRESLDSSVYNCDSEHVPSVKLKNQRNDCSTNGRIEE